MKALEWVVGRPIELQGHEFIGEEFALTADAHEIFSGDKYTPKERGPHLGYATVTWRASEAEPVGYFIEQLKTAFSGVQPLDTRFILFGEGQSEDEKVVVDKHYANGVYAWTDKSQGLIRVADLSAVREQLLLPENVIQGKFAQLRIATPWGDFGLEDLEAMKNGTYWSPETGRVAVMSHLNTVAPAVTDLLCTTARLLPHNPEPPITGFPQDFFTLLPHVFAAYTHQKST
ncbi:hypothetical protein GOV09_05240 [Candidatus Woesearchaeota archaeon]|nr:hypothetical protein [Candidatus Woesearchaeota archaeon]